MDFLGDVGGLYSSLFSIGYVLVSFFTHRLFISGILKHVYQVKTNKDGGDNKYLSESDKGQREEPFSTP